MTIKTILPTVILLGSMCSTACRAETVASTLEHINWALAHEEECREFVFGAERAYRRASAEGIVIVLRHLGPDDIEEQVVITKRGDEPAEARVTRLIGEGLLDQMAALHRLDPTISSELACQKLQIEVAEVKHEKWVAEAVARLQDMSISPVIEAPFVLHGHMYDIWIFTFAAKSEFGFSGTSSSDEATSPLEEWSAWVLSRWSAEPTDS